MKTYANKEVRLARTVGIRPYVHCPIKPMQQAQQAKIHHILRTTDAQAKLTIGQPDDKYEQEADRVADQVMAMPNSKLQRQPENEEEEETLQTKPLADQITPLVQRQDEPPEEEEEELQPKSMAGKTPTVTPSLESRINSLKSGGQTIDTATRHFFEPRFGYDFGSVRMHTDSAAADTAKSINARAFTLGNHIVMGSGEFQPKSQVGQRLLGHELTHVVQQGDRVNRKKNALTPFSVKKVTHATLQKQQGTGQQNQEQGTPLDRLLEALVQLPPARLEDFCQPWSSLQEARQVHALVLDRFVPALESQFGTEVGALWRRYLNRRHGASLRRLLYNNPSNQVVQGFNNSQTTRARQVDLANITESWFQRSCPQLPANFPVGVPVEQIVSSSERTYPIDFSDPFEIPGHIAGAVGSSDAGPDSRNLNGEVTFFRATDQQGHTTSIRMRTNFNFTVRDSIDFCPGSPGAGYEQNLTIPLSRLEKSGERWPQETFAYDVPFEVRFTPEPIIRDLSSMSVRACHPNARVQENQPAQEEADNVPNEETEEPGFFDRVFMRKPLSHQPLTNKDINTSVNHVISNNAGQILPEGVKHSMQKSLGADFSSVRIHTNSTAAQSARQLQAKAYTTGSHIVFAQGQYSPNSKSGSHLLAHELVHTIQQRASKPGVQRQEQPSPSQQQPQTQPPRSQTPSRSASIPGRTPSAATNAAKTAAENALNAVRAILLAKQRNTISTANQARLDVALDRWYAPTERSVNRNNLIRELTGQVTQTNTQLNRAALREFRTRSDLPPVDPTRVWTTTLGEQKTERESLEDLFAPATSVNAADAIAMVAFNYIGLGPRFFSAPDDAYRTATLIHEAGHFSIGLGHGDIVANPNLTPPFELRPETNPNALEGFVAELGGIQLPRVVREEIQNRANWRVQVIGPDAP